MMHEGSWFKSSCSDRGIIKCSQLVPESLRWKLSKLKSTCFWFTWITRHCWTRLSLQRYVYSRKDTVLPRLPLASVNRGRRSWISALHLAKNTLLDIRLSGFSFHKIVHVCECKFFCSQGLAANKMASRRKIKLRRRLWWQCEKTPRRRCLLFLGLQTSLASLWCMFEVSATLGEESCTALLQGPSVRITPYRTASFPLAKTQLSLCKPFTPKAGTCVAVIGSTDDVTISRHWLRLHGL